jgi:hypothetical protein
VNILDAMRDDNLFAPWFRDPGTWAAWRAFLAALFALPMDAEQLAVYRQCTGRSAPPSQPASEGWLVCGRRAGKSFILALCAVFLATFHDYRRYLAPGERATVLIIATNSKQARVIFRYVRALLTRVPMLAKLVERETAHAFDLADDVTIEVHVASYKTTRGYAIVAALCDEIAFWPHENSAEPDYEILNAIRPGTATIPNAMLLCASSPYARRGALWDAWRRHYGRDDDPVLVWRAPTRDMNPTVRQQVVDEATEADPASAAAEWLAEFRTDVEALLTREAVEACVSWDVRERPPLERTRYFAFVDPSGGSADSMTLAIGHRERSDNDVVVVDALRERRPPFSPEDVVREFCELLASYKIKKVGGDRYAGEWPRERFKHHSVNYETAQKPKSDLYRDVLPLINGRRIDLLDEPRLLTQLVGLERRTARGTGRDVIDHAPGGHDDLANAVAGLAATARRGSYDSSMAWVSGPYDSAEQERSWQNAQLEMHIRRTGGYFNFHPFRR